jgi:phospholipid/cholesterol/gamma-HCH transport system ATP-binding protein
MITIHALCKSLAGRVVLRGVDLAIARGTTVALTGSSGAGKSVLLRHIVGLLQPDEGDVIVDGVSVPRASRRDLLQLRRRIGYAFQDAALLDSLDVHDNLLLALDDDTARGATVTDRLAATLARVNLGPDVLRRRPDELSGGMRKRVGVARAIIHDPDLILYDEPTTGLDRRNATLMLEMIRRIAADSRATSIVVTHDVDSVDRFADRVIGLAGGCIAFDHSPDRFRAAVAAASHINDSDTEVDGRMSWC